MERVFDEGPTDTKIFGNSLHIYLFLCKCENANCVNVFSDTLQCHLHKVESVRHDPNTTTRDFSSRTMQNTYYKSNILHLYKSCATI